MRLFDPPGRGGFWLLNDLLVAREVLYYMEFAYFLPLGTTKVA